MSLLERYSAEPVQYSTGFRQLVYPADPAAGANLTIQLDSRWIQRLVSLRVTVTLANSGSNRPVTIDYLDVRGNIYNQDGVGAVQTINTANTYQFQTERTAGEWATGTTVFAPINSGFLDLSTAIRVTIGSIDASDAITSCFCVFERFDTG